MKNKPIPLTKVNKKLRASIEKAEALNNEIYTLNLKIQDLLKDLYWTKKNLDKIGDEK